jgi:glycosidase
MQWDASTNAGFGVGEPWLPLHSDHPHRNVAAQRDDPASVLSSYRDLIALRRAHPVIQGGNMALPDKPHPKVLAYTRSLEHASVQVLLNMSPQPQRVPVPDQRHLLYGTQPTRPATLEGGTLELAPHEGLVLGSSPSP